MRRFADMNMKGFSDCLEIVYFDTGAENLGPSAFCDLIKDPIILRRAWTCAPFSHYINCRAAAGVVSRYFSVRFLSFFLTPTSFSFFFISPILIRPSLFVFFLCISLLYSVSNLKRFTVVFWVGPGAFPGFGRHETELI